MKRGLLTIVLLLFVVALLLTVQSGILWVRNEDAVIESGDVHLAATLSLPRWESGPFPAVVVVHGSGPVRRREMRGYLRRLIPQGIAVLRYDKRGAGASTGSYGIIRVADSEGKLGELADDAAAAVAWLKGHAAIDGERVGLVGGSQAGWIMPLTAFRSDDVRFFASISGPAVTYGQEIYYSQLTGDDPGPFKNLSDEEIARRMAAFDGPHGYDPAATLDALTVPSLWILGAMDRSVPTALTVRNLEAVQAANPGLLDFHVFPEGNHSLRNATTGKRIDYWPRIYDWLASRGILKPAA